MKALVLLMACCVILPPSGFFAWAFLDLTFNKQIDDDGHEPPHN